MASVLMSTTNLPFWLVPWGLSQILNLQNPSKSYHLTYFPMKSKWHTEQLMLRYASFSCAKRVAQHFHLHGMPPEGFATPSSVGAPQNHPKYGSKPCYPSVDTKTNQQLWMLIPSEFMENYRLLDLDHPNQSCLVGTRSAVPQFGDPFDVNSSGTTPIS